jgi:hypothetical protein
MKSFWADAILLIILALWPMVSIREDAWGQDPAVPERAVAATVHVLSRISTGSLTVEQIAARAERLGVDAVVLTDDFSHRYEYGLWPLRPIVKRVVTFPSVLSYGVERMLAEITAVQARHPNVLLVPGVLTAPHYYWTGSWQDGNLTLRNSEQNVLVLGLTKSLDYERLPVIGNPATYRYGRDSVYALGPVLLFLPAAWLWRRPRRGPALLLAALAAGALLHAWPLRQPVYSMYAPDVGYQPAQTLIDTVARQGGITIWSMPEVRYEDRYSYGLLGAVGFRTDPHPEALIFTRGYTGFGALYLDHHAAVDPHGIWDQTLLLYLEGHRPTYPVAYGEIGFDGSTRSDLNSVLSILTVRTPGVAGVLEAMRAGRLYAVEQYNKPWGLRLDTFRAGCNGQEPTAEAGEMLKPGAVCVGALYLAVSATDHGAHPIEVTVIRSGDVMTRRRVTTPYADIVQDEHNDPRESRYYRIHIHGEGELVSNPIFVSTGG